MGQFFDIIKPFAGSECVVIFVRISSQNLDFYQFSLALKKHQIEQCLAPKNAKTINSRQSKATCTIVGDLNDSVLQR